MVRNGRPRGGFRLDGRFRLAGNERHGGRVVLRCEHARQISLAERALLEHYAAHELNGFSAMGAGVPVAGEPASLCRPKAHNDPSSNVLLNMASIVLSQGFSTRSKPCGTDRGNVYERRRTRGFHNANRYQCLRTRSKRSFPAAQRRAWRRPSLPCGTTFFFRGIE